MISKFILSYFFEFEKHFIQKFRQILLCPNKTLYHDLSFKKNPTIIATNNRRFPPGAITQEIMNNTTCNQNGRIAYIKKINPNITKYIVKFKPFAIHVAINVHYCLFFLDIIRQKEHFHMCHASYRNIYTAT